MSTCDLSCKKCNCIIVNNQHHIVCSKCKSTYDLECANISEKRFLSFYGANGKTAKRDWICSICTNKTQLKNTDTPPNDTNRRKEITIIRPQEPTINEIENEHITVRKGQMLSQNNDLASELRLFREDLQMVRTEMQSFASVVSSLTNALSQCTMRLDDLTSRVTILESNKDEHVCHINKVLEEEVSSLRLELNDRDQDVLANDLEVSGIPEEGNENVHHLSLLVAKKLGVELEDRDLVSAARVGPKRFLSDDGNMSQSTRPRPIVIRLVRKKQRDELIKAARVRRNTDTSDMSLRGAPRPFYVNERLTRKNRQLFYLAREKASKSNWKYVWTRDGKIYARRENGAPRHRLRSEADINHLGF